MRSMILPSRANDVAMSEPDARISNAGVIIAFDDHVLLGLT